MLCVLQVREVPGITIFRSSATMYFANAELYLEALEKKVNNFLFELYIFSMLECLITVVFSQGNTSRAHKGAFHPKGDKVIYIKTKQPLN